MNSPIRWIPVLILMLTVFIVVGCNTYYRTDGFRGESALLKINQAIGQGKIFMVVHGGTTYLATGVHLTEDAVAGTLAELPLDLEILRNDLRAQRGTRYSRRSQRAAPQQVLLYTRSATSVAPGQMTLAFDDIERVDVYSVDAGKTIASHTFGIVASTAAVLVVLTAIALATKDSCPFVYVWDGEGFLLAGEVYGGAIAPPLERSDYMALPALVPLDGQYRIRIANELKEHQFINMARMLHIEHPIGTRVLIDKTGMVHTVSTLEAPHRAATSGGREVGHLVARVDHDVYAFNDGEGDVNHLDLAFRRPSGVMQAKLVVEAKAAHWLDYVFDQYTMQFGALYDRWQARISARSPEELEAWYLSQSIPLKVQVQRNGDWHFAGFFEMVGPLAGTRELVMPIDLSGVDPVEVRLRIETGFSFWEIDAVALDFSENRPVGVTSVAARYATTAVGEDVSALLADDDGLYLKQLETGDVVELGFDAPVTRDGYAATLFLHAKGYYTPLRDYAGVPNIARLLKFKEPGRFTAFARSQYREFTGGLAPAFTDNLAR
jgi:hypothetical protein